MCRDFGPHRQVNDQDRNVNDGYHHNIPKGKTVTPLQTPAKGTQQTRTATTK